MYFNNKIFLIKQIEEDLMPKNIGAKRMEEMLNHWETSYFFQEIIKFNSNPFLKKMTYPNINKLRDALLTAAGDEILDVSFPEIFPANLLDEDEQDVVFNEAISVLLNLVSWNRHSRRVFHLSSDMQMLLDATSLKNIKWEHIRFPFDTFVVGLDTPLKDDTGKLYDAFLFSRTDELLDDPTIVPQWELKLLPQTLSTAKRLKETDVKKILRYINGNDSEFKHGLNYGVKKYFKPENDIQMLLVEKIEPSSLHGENVTDFLDRLNDSENILKNHPLDSAFHILINLCLYLENFPSSITKAPVKKSRDTKKKRKQNKGFPKSFVDDSENLFTVLCQFKIKKEEVKKLANFVRISKNSHEKRAHWRRAHWRRKPNCGHISFEHAPKDWIPMKFVNAHKLPTGTLPLATEAIL